MQNENHHLTGAALHGRPYFFLNMVSGLSFDITEFEHLAGSQIVI
jgi:hypothetical protein